MTRKRVSAAAARESRESALPPRCERARESVDIGGGPFVERAKLGFIAHSLRMRQSVKRYQIGERDPLGAGQITGTFSRRAPDACSPHQSGFGKPDHTEPHSRARRMPRNTLHSLPVQLVAAEVTDRPGDTP